MKTNIGTLDRTIRILLSVIVAVLFITGQINGAAAVILGIFAVVFLLTGFTGFCPLYAALKLKTVKKHS